MSGYRGRSLTLRTVLRLVVMPDLLGVPLKQQREPEALHVLPSLLPYSHSASTRSARSLADTLQVASPDRRLSTGTPVRALPGRARFCSWMNRRRRSLHKRWCSCPTNTDCNPTIDEGRRLCETRRAERRLFEGGCGA